MATEASTRTPPRKASMGDGFGDIELEIEPPPAGSSRGKSPARKRWKVTHEERSTLVQNYLPLVKKIARGLARRSSDPVEDLIQVGSIGLLEAIDRYEYGHNTEFKTYAVHYITGHIRHYLRDKQNLMRGPRVLQELSYRLHRITKDLIQTLGREPTNSELAQALSITAERVDEIKVYDRRVTVLWLDQVNTDHDEEASYSLMNTLSDPRSAEGEEERMVLSEAIDRLQPIEREILELRYFHDLTQIELSRRLKLSQMEVCRRLKQAEIRLRAMLLSEGVTGSRNGVASR